MFVVVLLLAFLNVGFGSCGNASDPKDPCAPLCDALDSFYNATNGPDWGLPSWETPWFSNDPNPCNWGGVGCHNSSSCSTFHSFALSGKNIQGIVPTDFGVRLHDASGGNIDHFQLVNLPSLSGDIRFLAGITSLTYLAMPNCGVSSSPGSLEGILRSNPLLCLVDFSKTFVGGPFPSGFCHLFPAKSCSNPGKTFNCPHCRFTGSLPNFLSCDGLQFLDLSFNQFSDALPEVPSSLVSLNLAGNSLKGEIPRSFKTLRRLETLDLSENLLAGTLENLTICNGTECADTDPGNPFGTTSLRLLRLRGNHFSFSIEDLIDNILFHGPTIVRFPLATLDLSNNNLTGKLTGKLGDAFFLQRINLKSNPLDTGLTFPSYLSADNTSRQYFDGDERYWCPFYTFADGILIVEVDANVFSYFECKCAANFFGVQSLETECKPCSEGAKCGGGTLMELEIGLTPVLGSEREFVGTEKCPSSGLSSCNPNGTFVYEWRQEIDYNQLCPEGMTGRFCSQCQPAFYKTELGCESCIHQNSLLLGIIGGILVLLIVLYIVTPCLATKLGLVVFRVAFVIQVIVLILGVALSTIPLLANWVLDALLLILLMQIDESWDRLISTQHHSNYIAGVLSGQKIILFYLQATILLNIDVWGSWAGARWVSYSFEFINLKLRGLLECAPLFSSVYSDPRAPVVLTMITPFVLFVIMAISAWIQHLLEDCARGKSSNGLESEELLAGPKNSSEHVKLPPSITLQDHLFNIFLRIFYVAYFELCAILFEALRCSPDPIYPSDWFSGMFPWLPCDHSVLAPVAVPFLVLYVLGIPCLFAALLWRHRKHKDAHVRYWLGFVYENYVEGREFYELLSFLSRALLAACLVLPSPLSSVALLLILMGSMAVQLTLQPYKSSLDGKLYLLACAVILLTHSQIAVVEQEKEHILRLVNLFGEGGAQSTTKLDVLLGFLSILNIGFLLFISLVIVHAVWCLWRKPPSQVRLEDFAEPNAPEE